MLIIQKLEKNSGSKERGNINILIDNEKTPIYSFRGTGSLGYGTSPTFLS